MTNKSPAFQFYPDDWLACEKVACMTPEQEGAYIRLLCYMWRTEDCSLPDDDAKLSVLSRLNEGWFNGGSTVVRECFYHEDGKLYHKRLIGEREKQREWREKSSLGGKASAKTRKANRLSAVKGGSPLVQPKGNSPSPTVSPTPPIENPPNPPPGGTRKRGLTLAQKRRCKVATNTPEMVEIGRLFGRKDITLWSVYESEALGEILPIPRDDMDLLNAYYSFDHKKDVDFRRHAVEQLLNNWNGELDKAHKWVASSKKKKSAI